eukprot:scaffold70929_cov69-Phaeocystis_antarctica.AAC.1
MHGFASWPHSVRQAASVLSYSINYIEYMETHMILAPWMWSRGGALHVTDRHSNLGPAPLGARGCCPLATPA